MQYSGPPSSGPPRPVWVDPKRQRARMVRELESRGINDAAVLAAMNAVPRHLFVQEALRAHAYEDTALPIGYGQTISQPSTVARMTMLLETFPGCRVLEVGTGSGYQTAVLAALGCVVITIECVRELHQHTRRLFQSLALRDVHSLFGDGTLGLPDAAPYDRIIVTAGGPVVPQPLLRQLDDGGILLIPVGTKPRNQRLLRLERRGAIIEKTDLGPATFVDLVGDHGW